MKINNDQSTYTNSAYSSKGFSGMYSGIDTESLVQSMLSGIQNKIDKQNQTKQQLTWKQEIYRDIIDQINSFQSKYLDLTSSTSLRMNSFFDTMKTSSSSSAVSVTAKSGAKDGSFKVQVARLATASSVTSSRAGSGKIEFDAGSLTENFKYDRSVNIKIGNRTFENIDFSGMESADDVAQAINSTVGEPNFVNVKKEYYKLDGDKETALEFKDGQYKDKDGNIVDASDVKSRDVGFEFKTSEEFQISGSSAGMAILGLSGTVKSAADGDTGNYKAESNAANVQFAKPNAVNGTVDFTLDGVKKTFTIKEGESMQDLADKVKAAFGSSVTFEKDSTSGKWNISVEGQGRNITMSANAETMAAMGFDKGTTTLSSQLVRSDKVGKVLGIDPTDTSTRSFEINGKTIEYTANDSVSSIMNKINSSGAGVKISYNDLNDTFKMEATSTGAGYDIKVKGDSDGLFEKLGFNFDADGNSADFKAGQNALVNINGTTVERASNTFTFNGFSITAKTVTGKYDINNYEDDGTFKTIDGKPDDIAEITTSRDTDKIVDTLKSFVEDYNSLIEKLNKYTHEKATYKKYPPLTDAQKKEMSEKEIELWEEKSKEGLLRNDKDISRFLSDMRSTMYANTGAGIILANIGIDSSSNWKDYGKLTIDEDKLKKALETNAEGVQKLFAGENGLAKKFEKVCKEAANVSSGAPGSLVSMAGVVGKGTEKSNIIQAKLDSITKKLSSLNVLYEKRKARYWKQFNSMETALSNMDSQSSWLSNFMG